MSEANESGLTGIRWFLESNEPAARVLRTIVQGIIGVVISYLGTIATNSPEIISLLVIPIIMAVLSPIMAEIGKTLDKESEDIKPGGTD